MAVKRRRESKRPKKRKEQRGGSAKPGTVREESKNGQKKNGR